MMNSTDPSDSSTNIPQQPFPQSIIPSSVDPPENPETTNSIEQSINPRGDFMYTQEDAFPGAGLESGIDHLESSGIRSNTEPSLDNTSQSIQVPPRVFEEPVLHTTITASEDRGVSNSTESFLNSSQPSDNVTYQTIPHVVHSSITNVTGDFNNQDINSNELNPAEDMNTYGEGPVQSSLSSNTFNNNTIHKEEPPHKVKDYVWAYKVSDYWDIVREELIPIAEGNVTLDDIVRAIKRFIKHQRPKSDPQLTLFSEFFCPLFKGEQFEHSRALFSFIADLILKAPNLINRKIPILTQGTKESITFTKTQCACLLAQMFMCVNIPQDSTNLAKYYNFYFVLEGSKAKSVKASSIEKIKCMLSYFRQILKEITEGSLALSRLVQSDLAEADRDLKRWIRCNARLTNVELKPTGKIEDAKDAIQVSFSNSLAGGQALTVGKSQQEIMFFTSPELLLTTLFCENMQSHEAIMATGAKQYCTSKETSQYIEFDKDFDGSQEESSSIPEAVLMIDAISFKAPKVLADLEERKKGECAKSQKMQHPKQEPSQNEPLKDESSQNEPPKRETYPTQFSRKAISRELLKAHTGFSGPDPVQEPSNKEEKKKEGEETKNDSEQARQKGKKRPIATGKWGCGEYEGNVHLKFIIQWLAASRVGRDVLFYAFRDMKSLERVEEVLKKYENAKVSDLIKDVITCADIIVTQSEEVSFDFFGALLNIPAIPTIPTGLRNSRTSMSSTSESLDK